MFSVIPPQYKVDDSFLDQRMTHRMWFLCKMALSLKEKLKLALGDKTKESFSYQGSTDSSVLKNQKNRDSAIWTKWKEELELIKEQEIKNEEKYYRKMYTGKFGKYTVEFQSHTTRSDFPVFLGLSVRKLRVLLRQN